LRMQRQFTADASHELRTPVSVVRAAAEVTLGREHRDEAEYREALAIVGGQARRLGHLVEDLLVLARADAGGYPLRPVDLYLDEVVSECRRAVDVLAAERGVTIRAEQSPEIPFRGDEDLLRQLVLNLLRVAADVRERRRQRKRIHKRSNGATETNGSVYYSYRSACSGSTRVARSAGT